MKTAIKRPLLHYVIILGYVLAPIVNIVFYARAHQITTMALLQNLFTVFSPLAAVLLLTEPIVGLGLFFIHRVSWYAFIAHSTLVIADNLLKLWATHGAYQWSVLASSAVFIGIIAYVLQKDFRAPYFQAIARSWREKRRVPIHHYIQIAGEEKEIADFSASGCFVSEPGLQLALGSRVPIRLSLEKMDIDFVCEGEVVRSTPAGFGIRFINIPRRDQHRLNIFFRNKFPLRYAVSIDCFWQGQSSMATQGKTVDISRDGCFIAANISKFSYGETGALHLRIGTEDFILEGKVIWKNKGEFIKPLGAGLQFSAPQRRLMRKLHAAYPDLPLTR